MFYQNFRFSYKHAVCWLLRFLLVYVLSMIIGKYAIVKKNRVESNKINKNDRAMNERFKYVFNLAVIEVAVNQHTVVWKNTQAA